MAKLDLRNNDWREAIISIGEAVEKIPLNNRALALLIADSCPVRMTQVLEVLMAIPKLKDRYLKRLEK